MLTIERVTQVANDKGLVLEQREWIEDGVRYRYSLYDNNEFAEDCFETLAQAWSYIYYYDEEREYENLR